MIYLYDNAIVEDLNKSFNSDVANPVVKVVAPDQIVGVVAQVQDDEIKFPFVTLERPDAIDVNSNLTNFTMLHSGVSAVFDKEKNNYWNERAIPINLSYVLSVFTTNQADMDEIIRELMFKYLSMYFLSIRIPYESKREISFGVIIDGDSGISKQSSVSEYTSSGALYQSSITLRCEGCVLVHYTPIHLKRTVIDIDEAKIGAVK